VRPSSWSVSLKNVAPDGGFACFPAVTADYSLSALLACLQHYWKACFVTELTDAAIAAHIEHGARLPVVNSTAHIYPINGACHDVAPEATAFGHRNAAFATVIAGMWPDPADKADNRAKHRLGQGVLRRDRGALGARWLCQFRVRG